MYSHQYLTLIWRSAEPQRRAVLRWGDVHSRVGETHSSDITGHLEGKQSLEM